MVAPIVIAGVFDVATRLIDRFFPDKAASDAAKLELLKMTQTGELAQLASDTNLATKQAEINIEEAKSDNFFVSGWRPAVGWVCAAAFAAKFIGGPLIFVAAQFTSHTITLPPIDMTEMLPILVGMLGLGAFRSYDKKQQLING